MVLHRCFDMFVKMLANKNIILQRGVGRASGAPPGPEPTQPRPSHEPTRFSLWPPGFGPVRLPLPIKRTLLGSVFTSRHLSQPPCSGRKKSKDPPPRRGNVPRTKSRRLKGEKHVFHWGLSRGDAVFNTFKLLPARILSRRY